MARKRLRKEWPMLAYKFWIQRSYVPQRVWDTAKQMQALWNQLVDLCNAASERINTADPPLSEDEKKQIYGELAVALRKAEHSSELNWECREFVSDKFRVAFHTAVNRIKNGATPAEAGFPGKRLRLNKVSIRHRYSGGGVRVSRLFQPYPAKSIKRFSLKPVPQEVYSDNSRKNKRLRYSGGFFGIGDVKMPFRVLLHRQIPQEAFVKNTVLIGKHQRRFGWDWAIALICEIPPMPIDIQRTGRFCGLDLGWRKFDSYLRIGMLVDSDGNVIELRLPLDMSNRPTRNFNRWIEQVSRPDADKIYETWEDIREATCLVDRSLELVKEQVAELAEKMELPDDIRVSLSPIGQMRQEGCIQLLDALREANVGQNLQNLIAGWREIDDKAQRRIQSARLRLVRRRHWLYQNLADWIARNYDIISWETDLRIKRMAEDREKTPALHSADRNRQIAAIGDFTNILKHQARKRNALLIDGVAAYSTVTCFTCGERTTGGAELMLQCSNGHRFDQDENAARGFLSKIDHEVRAAFNLRQRAGRTLPRGIEVPDSLKGVIVPKSCLRVPGGIEGDTGPAVQGPRSSYVQ